MCIPGHPFAFSVLLSVDNDICQLFLVHVVVSCCSKISVDNFKMSVALASVAPNFVSWYEICELSVVLCQLIATHSWQLTTH